MDKTTGKSRENPIAHMKNEPGSGKSPSQAEKQRTKEFGKADKKIALKGGFSFFAKAKTAFSVYHFYLIRYIFW